jgi:hypothetical protein
VITLTSIYALQKNFIEVYTYEHCLFGTGAMTPLDSILGAAQHTDLQIQLSRNNSLKVFFAFVLQMEGYLRSE